MTISAITPGPLAHTQLGAAGRKYAPEKGQLDFAALSAVEKKPPTEEALKAQKQKPDSHHDRVADDRRIKPSEVDRIKPSEVRFKFDGTRERIKLLDNGTKMRTPLDDKKASLNVPSIGEGVATGNTKAGALNKALFDVSA